MASKQNLISLQKLRTFLRGARARDPPTQCLTPSFCRSMASEAALPIRAHSNTSDDSLIVSHNPVITRRAAPSLPDVLTTIYDFPSMEPTRFVHYPSSHLNVPFRKDILHKAVIFEADGARQGTASTKWRNEVRGSSKKLRPQKGMGMARLGDRKSPMLRGGGRAFGPKPRDFSTKLPRKIYDLAWRIALSYRFRRGELILIGDGANLEMAEPRWITQILERNHFGNENGRSLIVTSKSRDELFTALAGAGDQGIASTEDKLDIRALLKLGRVIMEKGVLDRIMKNHSSDLNVSIPSAAY